ncbi:hypothetical protein SARC_12665 [Sphaeroforma arctica JP610]|uniref:Uncharacterized protein n=1 Tax=Sphaeroforma arctica JP610 TaxID=667725 RepID=A0A0L0FDG3_9EUKA|nr:hypothetical protein SARC_12665 [Sphaeroforma arctica JP610]KNC74795.1 hypothetical protein SARC_12665 [Sphaeroforma arctica JP610]|eukprot:XP_014148697.1 hypothetical protein SARC_12665 [Sphaeroforma arctica JP610]
MVKARVTRESAQWRRQAQAVVRSAYTGGGTHRSVSNASRNRQKSPAPIPTLHKIRVDIHDQQPERRMSQVDAELRRRYDQAINDCGDEDKIIQISLYMSELELMRSHLDDQINEPSLKNYSRLRNFQDA